MGLLLSFSSAIDKVNEKLGVICNWLVLLACLVLPKGMDGATHLLELHVDLVVVL